MKKTFLQFILIFSLALFSLPVFAQVNSSLPNIKVPDMQINIPTVNLSKNVTCNNLGEKGGSCEIPWIGEYIVGIANYAVGFISIIAIVIMMWGGVLWITAAGRPDQVTEARSWIMSSLIGLLVMLCSYIILATINPALITFKPLVIGTVEKADLPDIDLSSSSIASNPEFSSVVSGNPYKSICDQYGGKYNESVAQQCLAKGSAVPSNMVKTSWGGNASYADSDVVQKYNNAINCVRSKYGNTIANKFSVSSSWRSAKRQYEIYNDKKRTNAAALPCCSNHGAGVALDLRYEGSKLNSWSVSDGYLKECMNQNGLYANLRSGKTNEPWHYSPTGR